MLGRVGSVLLFERAVGTGGDRSVFRRRGDHPERELRAVLVEGAKPISSMMIRSLRQSCSVALPAVLSADLRMHDCVDFAAPQCGGSVRTCRAFSCQGTNARRIIDPAGQLRPWTGRSPMAPRGTKSCNASAPLNSGCRTQARRSPRRALPCCIGGDVIRSRLGAASCDRSSSEGRCSSRARAPACRRRLGSCPP